MKKLIFVALFIILISQCESFHPDREYCMYLSNESDVPISYYYADGVFEYSKFYPDTTLPEQFWANYYVVINPNEKKGIWVRGYKMDEFFTTYPADTMSVFIFHADTLNKYTWEEVRDGYVILERYDLSLDDLKRMDFTITYP